MDENNPLINIGDLAKPATMLIEKISDAIGAIFQPYQIKRMAKAQSEAGKIEALTKIEISEIEQRAIGRLVTEEAKKQENIESITNKAIEDLNTNARPEDVEPDWLSYFFDKCRLVSDGQMQSLWARVLAGEANNPGQYSKRTINFISSLDKSEAMLFTKLCSFCWYIEDFTPLIYAYAEDIYRDNGINFDTLVHLDDIGLINIEFLTGFAKDELPEITPTSYHGIQVKIKFTENDKNDISNSRWGSSAGDLEADLCVRSIG